MIIRLSQFIFCFALFYSSQSAAYNEAMCILIKQEMQQYSFNKSSAKYRNAARDYKRNCNKPKQVQAQPKPVEPQPVINEPQPVALTPEQEQQMLEQIKAAEKKANELNNILPENAKNSQLESAPTEQSTVNEPELLVTEPETSTISNEQNTSPVTLTPEVNEEPKVQAALSKPAPAQVQPVAPIKPKPTPIVTPKPVVEPPSSLLLPSLLLLIVILVGAMALIRLHRAKQNKTAQVANPITPNKEKAKPDNMATVSAQNKDIDSAPAIKEKNSSKHVNSPESINSPEPSNSLEPDLAPQPPESSKPENAELNSAEILNTQQKANTAEEVAKSETSKKPIIEPNTAEFEAAAKNTLARIQSANGFAEPEVREFDPDAPSVKRERKNKVADVTAQPKAKNITKNSEQESVLLKETELPSNPVDDTNVHTQIDTAPKDSDLEQVTINDEHGFKEPEIRTYNPDAPLRADKKSSQIKPSNSNNQQSTHALDEYKTDEAKEPEAKSDNPFANLSLDESWDPNSDKKPTIEQKKKAPKSQALIDAEQRAKNMQTKD